MKRLMKLRYAFFFLSFCFFIVSCGDDCEPVSCNTDCTAGDIEEWDEDECTCIVKTIVTLGCTDALALNYNPNANCDDASCDLECPDPGTCNTDCALSNIESWDTETCSCILIEETILGCTDEAAANFDPNANCDDDSCEYVIQGCTDSQASNYNANATEDDGSCTYDSENFIGDYLSSLGCLSDPVLAGLNSDSVELSIVPDSDSEDISKVALTFSSDVFTELRLVGNVNENKLFIPETNLDAITLSINGALVVVDLIFSGEFELFDTDLFGDLQIEVKLSNGVKLGEDTCEMIARRL